MKSLTELVIEYKKTKNKRLWGEILKIIDENLKKKVSLVFAKLKYYQIEKEDIKQELLILILQIIDNYDISKPFENYLFSSIKHWTPKLTKDDTTDFKRQYKVNQDTGEETEIEAFGVVKNNEHDLIDNFENLNENEIKIINLFQENGNIKQTEIAKIIGVTKQRVKQILQGLKNKYVD
jgi:RNA polymerase sigma factor (sigma-70 family)